MRKSNLALLVLVFVLGLALHHASGMTELEAKRVREGIKAAQAISKAMKGLEALKWVAKIGSVAGPLLMVASLALEIAMMFIKIDSPEMLLMKAEFSNLNARLDQFSVQFSEVKRKIEWSAIQLAFAKYERTIRVLNDERLALGSQKDKVRFEMDKKRFIRKYDSDWEEASTKLYQAMVTKSVLTNNIFHAARTYTQNHEGLTFEFIKGTIQLLMQAYSVDVAVMKLKYNDSAALEYLEADIQKKIKEVQASAMNVQKEIRSVWQQQMQSDVRNEVIMAKGSSNQHFSQLMYKYLANKYPWREWFVLAFNKHGAVGDWRKHASHQCGGARFINLGERNTVVGSVEKSAVTPFSKTWAHDRMRRIGKFKVSDNYGQKLLDKMMTNNDQTKCSPAAVMATVRRNDHREFVADAWVYTNKKRLHFEQSCAPYKCNDPACWVKKDKCFSAIMWG